MESSPFVSVVLLNYNGMIYIRNCVQSVLQSDYENFEAIIVDNNSTDNSIDLIEDEFKNDDRVNIIRSNENLGYAASNNLAARYARGSYLAFLNIDTIVEAKWLDELAQLLECDNTIGVAQPILLSLSNSSIYDSAGDYIDFFGNCFILGGGWEEKDNGQYDTVHDIFSAWFTRRELVEEIGLFDEDFFMNYEDIDFCWRVRLYGKRVLFMSRSVVYHKGFGIMSKNEFLRHREMHVDRKSVV